jgi:acyl dehydratase
MSDLTEALYSQIGRLTGAYVHRAELGDLIRFATMLGYTQPWYVDEIMARRSRFGGIVAVPTYLIVMRRLEHRAFADIGIEPPRVNGVDGGSSWAYAELIRAGDVITATASVTGVDERETRLGPTIFQRIESTYQNQFSQLVARQRDTRIYYE